MPDLGVQSLAAHVGAEGRVILTWSTTTLGARIGAIDYRG